MTDRPLTILHTESSGVLGGQEYRLLAEARGMAARGHRIVLAIPHDSEARPLAEAAGLTIEPLLFRRFRYGPLFLEFLRLIRRYRPDIVHTHGSLDSWTASLAARVSLVRPLVVRTRHKSIPVSRSARHRLLYRTLPHGVVTTGMAVRRHLMDQFDIPAEKIVSIPSGVDLQRFRADLEPGRLRRELGMGPTQPLIGTVAFIRAYKGLNDFVTAAATVARTHPDARFVIAGDGDGRAQLERQIDELKLADRIALLGHRTDVPEILADLNIFVLPTLEDAMPQSLTQAMAMRRPVVTTTVGGIPEIVRDGVTGLLVPPRAPDRLAAAVQRLWGDRALREKIAEEGYRLICNGYTSEHMLDKTEAFYRYVQSRQG